MDDLSVILEQIIPVIRATVNSRYAIALAGSMAKGTADAESDIDLFVYADGVQSWDVRKALIEGIADSGTKVHVDQEIDKTYWGGCMDFTYCGRKIETTVRSLAQIDEVVARSLSGEIEVQPVFWTLHGYYSYIYLSEIDFVRPLDDPHGILARLKELTRCYPPLLKQAILKHFWRRTGFWLDNFHYISAIRRADIVYTSGIVQHTLHSMIQVIFAVNERYFGGDKKIEQQLRSLAWCPADLLENLELLMAAPRDSDALEKQRQILKGAAEEIHRRL